MAQEANNIKIDSLRSEVKRLQSLLNKQKLDLADAILEVKEANNTINNLEDLKQQQFKTISNLTNENNDLKEKVEKAILHIEERDDKVSLYEDELLKVKASLIKTRDTTIESLAVAETSKKELKEANALKEKAEEKYLKTKEEFGALWSQNTQYSEKIEFLEFRIKELTDTLDELFKERNHLQNTIDRLLMGANKIINYSPQAEKANDNTVLEPSSLAPYIPFCFPERVSSLIKFKREIRETMRGSIKPPPKRKLPKVFSHKNMDKKFESLRGFKVSNKIMERRSLEWDIKKLEPPAKLLNLEYQRLSKAGESRYVISKVHEPSKETQLLEKSNILPLRQLNLLSVPFQMPKSQKFDIMEHSHQAFIQHISCTLIKDSEWHRQRTREKNLMQTLSLKLFKPAPKNIFIRQTLAFRYRLSIKSHMKMVRKTDMKYSFLKEHRLKSVLETFGKTLDSMVQRYGA